MKICFISSYPPEQEGVGQFTKRLIDHFDIEGFDISVLTFNYRTTYGDNNIFQVLGASPKHITRTYTCLKSLNPDIIHVQYATSVYRIYSLLLWSLLWIYKKRHKVSIVVTFHEVSRETHLLRTPGIKYYSVMSSIADHIIVHTEEARQILIDVCKVDRTKISRVPLGLYNTSSNLASPNRRLQSIDSIGLVNRTIILFFGYIHIDKGIEYLIEAFHILLNKHPEEQPRSLLLIAGDVRPRKGLFKVFGLLDKRYKAKLIKLIENCDLEDSVKFLGHIEEKDVLALLNSSDAIVMPYTRVEQSGVLNLALNSSIPIIATNIGGLREVLQETTLTFEPENPQLLEEKLYLVFQNKLPRNLTKIYSQIRTDNSLTRVIDDHVAIYNTMYEDND